MIRRRHTARTLVATSMLGVAALAGCRTGPLAPLKPIPRDTIAITRVCDAAATDACTGEVSFTYLGVGGFLIRAGNDAVMTSPFFSHAALLRISIPVLFHIKSDSTVVDAQLHKLLGADADSQLARVRTVLVGHSHYDHALDVPYIMRAYTPNARLIAGMTTKRILMGDSWFRAHADQIDSVPLDAAGTPWRLGTWVTVAGGRMRIMPLRSSHAHNFLKFTIAPGHADYDYDHLPTTAWGWKMGDPYSYLIDVLDTAGHPVFRVLYQDAAAQPMDVLLPLFPIADQRRVDVAIICAGNFEKVPDYPTLLAGALHPRVILVGHWENFFRSMDAPLAPVPFTKTTRLAERLDLAAPDRWFTLEPGGRLRVQY